jgi:hypothetical protein
VDDIVRNRESTVGGKGGKIIGEEGRRGARSTRLGAEIVEKSVGERKIGKRKIGERRDEDETARSRESRLG